MLAPALIALGAVTATLERADARCGENCRAGIDRRLCREMMNKQGLKGDKRKSEYDACVLDRAAYQQAH